MDVQPATVDQVQAQGGFEDIRVNENEIAAALARIDAGLRVRFSKAGRCWVIEHWHHGECPCNRPGGRDGDRYFVSSVQARQSAVSGVWLGLDGQVVRKFEEINPLGRRGYDLAAELEISRREREREERHARHEKWGEIGERAAHALRKDLHLGPYKGRAFVTSKPKELK